MLVFLYVCMSILLFNPDNLKRTGYTKAQIFFGPELAKKDLCLEVLNVHDDEQGLFWPRHSPTLTVYVMQ